LKILEIPVLLQSFLKLEMANHKSSIKRIRSNEAKRDRNRYQHKSTRTVVKAIRKAASKSDAEGLLKNAVSMLDKLAKTNVIHKNKAGNLKSSLQKRVNALK
jgi:small subunit ribosomal protein S20